MKDFYCNNYIPDLTERYPEGFRTFDDDYNQEDYEPSYDIENDPEYIDISEKDDI